MNEIQILLILALTFLFFFGFRRQFFEPFRQGHYDPVKGEKAQAEAHIILLNHSPFYRNLSTEASKKFLNRTGRFMMGKRFIGMEGLQVTFEMKVRLAATAVQITFGLKKQGLSHYRTVKIFPGTFFSKIHGRHLKGGASTGGTLFFSWKDFEEGYDDPADRYNLGMHEMAHALRLELVHGNDFDSRFADYSDRWLEVALPEFEKMNAGKGSFLREYGGTNLEEFFAVCVEHFFEVPEEFKKNLPDIYNHLCFLLNLDPTRPDHDYAPIPGFIDKVNADGSLYPIPVRVNKAWHYYNWHWSFNIICAGLLGGFGVIVYYYGRVLYTLPMVALFFLSVAIATTAFKKFFLSKGILSYPHLLLFALGGVAPILGAAILMINYHVTTADYEEVHRVTGFRFIARAADGYSQGYYLLELEEEAYKQHRRVRMVAPSTIRVEVPATRYSLKIGLSIGFPGMVNLKYKRLIAEPGESFTP